MDTRIKHLEDLETSATGCANSVCWASSFHYGEAIGILIYLMFGRCPDLDHAAEQLANFCENPTSIHWNTIRRVLRYIMGPINLGLCLSGRDKIDLGGYNDSDFTELAETESLQVVIFW